MVLATQPKELSLYIQIADLQMQNGDRAGAINTLQTALQIDSKAPQIRQIQRMLAQLKAPSNNSTQGAP